MWSQKCLANFNKRNTSITQMFMMCSGKHRDAANAITNRTTSDRRWVIFNSCFSLNERTALNFIYIKMFYKQYITPPICTNTSTIYLIHENLRVSCQQQSFQWTRVNKLTGQPGDAYGLGRQVSDFNRGALEICELT